MVTLMGAAHEFGRLLRVVASHWDEQQRVVVTGLRDTGAGSNVALRFLAARACEFVRVHVQHDGAGGGGATYNSSTFVSSDRRDVRADRQRDETITRNGVDSYFVWLIPERLNPDGSYTRFDGADGADLMAFYSLGA